MKKYPLLIYRDEVFEDETRAGIKDVYDGYVKLLSIWNDLNVGECSDLFTLAANASKVYSDAFQANVEVPETVGKYQLNKSAFLNIIDVPVPNNLYVQARAITKMPCFGYQNIWSIKDGQVIQDEEQAEAVIHSRNIYANNEEQEELGKACIEYVRLSNFIDRRFTEIPWQYFPAPPWSLVGKHFPNIAMLTLEVEQLRIILEKL